MFGIPVGIFLLSVIFFLLAFLHIVPIIIIFYYCMPGIVFAKLFVKII